MNRICEFKKIIISFFVAIFLAMLGLGLKYLGNFKYGIDVIFGLSIYNILLIGLSIPINDLHLESNKLLFISFFQIKEEDLESLHISSICVTPTGPRFVVKTKKKEYLCFFTEDNYEILKRLIEMNKVDTTIEELDRMIKYSVIPIKRRKK